MIESLLSLPTALGCIVFMGLTTAVGFAVYFVTFRLHARRHSDDVMKEICDATGNLFRVVGWLLTLLLSLTFSNGVRQLVVIDNAIEGEAAAISDTHHNLRRFGLEETRKIQTLLADYAQAVIDNEWRTLANDELSERAGASLRQLEDAIYEMKVTNKRQEILQSRVIADLDAISDYRLSRLAKARERPSVVLIVVFFGYLVTMVYFGIYRPCGALLGLLSLYTLFVGVTIYLVLATSYPFQIAMGVESAPLEYVLEAMRADR
jgi:hypothetical protein